ncbi:hypothetical protein H4R34_004436 [Dimargaris verticillata]|uniref:P-type ATPase A domain-containing protein n=1 Tax=Dimargaris verticillata TaxID=2761393 RepID=A0A9W8EBP4_9FUNG|nr:hypothetical protein H4R34_004436 [Dimargaris verticillata]
MHIWALLTTLGSFWCLVVAIPRFHDINDHDPYGNKCPLSERNGVECPRLCVTDTDLCPPELAPVCPPGETYCLDGTCRASCMEATNMCMCGQSVADVGRELYPCASQDPISIPQYDPHHKEEMVAEHCAAAWQPTNQRSRWTRADNSSVPVYWGDSLTVDQVWLQCPEPAPRQLQFNEPMFIVFYSLLGAQISLLVFWALRRSMFSMKEPRRPVTAHCEVASEKDASSFASDKSFKVATHNVYTTDQDGEMVETMATPGLTIKGFRRSFLGTAILVTVLLTTLGWLVLLGVIVSDYYGAFDGESYSVFANSQLSSKVFVVVWHFAVVWFLALNLSEPRVSNFFRLPCPLHQARFVQIEKVKDQVIMIQSRSRWLKELRIWERRLQRITGHGVVVKTAQIAQTATTHQNYFEFQCTRYVYHPQHDQFLPCQLTVGDTHAGLFAQRHGISSDTAARRQDAIGPNFIHVAVPNFARALLEEFLGFFYLYQMMCLWVWYYFNYYYMGVEQTAVILLSALVKVIIRLRSERRVKQMAEYRNECQVLRDDQWVAMHTVDLVPGDVVALTANTQIPCDGALLWGELIVDESSLTGEAMPIRKFPLKDDQSAYQRLGTSRTNALSDGTRVLQTMPGHGGPIPNNADASAGMLVTTTRTNTDKGQLVQKILFPTAYSFIFNEQLKLVILILLLWGGICFAIVYWFLGEDISTWFYGIFTISFIMSPLLPAMLVVGQSVAASRLRAKHIYCVDLPRIMIAGKVHVFCFDKTGTLTKEGLEFYGLQATESHTLPEPTGSFVALAKAEVKNKDLRFGPRCEHVANVDNLWQMGLASCHSVTKVNDTLIGNPVDIELFTATQWSLSEKPESSAFLDTLVAPTCDNQALQTQVHVLKRFEFVHARASMSVAVLDPHTQHVHIFVKGSFEKLKDYARADSVPYHYDSVTAAWAKEGCYVLAMGHRDLGPLDQLSNLDELTRDDLESNLTLLGLVLFKNKLKSDTTEAIRELREGNTRTVMITGDTALTGVYIARACEMLPAGVPVALADVDDDGKVHWVDVDSDSPVPDIEAWLTEPTNLRPELAVTGRAFGVLVTEGFVQRYLDHIRIFARMTPDGKVQCIQLHMQRYITAMCGDGGNDCGALRAAHVGLALSESEASIVSPFSSSHRSVMSCVELLRQGRTALVTSFAAYKFIILYGETMAWLGLLQYYFSVIVPQAAWILIDGFITVGLSCAITQAKTRDRLAPRRPTARLLGPQTLASAIGQVLINLVFLIGSIGMLFQQPWYRCNEFDAADVDAAQWWLLGDNYEAEIIALTVLYQFVNAAAVFNFGYYFRKSWWTNYIMVVLYSGFMVTIMVLTLMDPNPFSCLFRINCGTPSVLVQLGYPEPTWHIAEYNSPLGHNVLPRSYRWQLWGLCLANCAVNLIYEYVFVLGPVGRYLKRRFGKPDRTLAL